MRMMAPAIALLAAGFAGLPAEAQDYFSTAAAARHGNGYEPSAIVAGWEGDQSFAVIAIAPDGKRAGNDGVAADWKATLTTGPRAAPENDDEEDERYLDRAETTPRRTAQAEPPVPRREIIYLSTTCPALMMRIAALQPLTRFEFDPPSFKGNQDGPTGDGREGFDLWLRVGSAELNRSAESKDSTLGRWFDETTKALAACPGAPRTPS